MIDGLRGWTQVPIVVLSARGSERDKVAALDAGADDYVVQAVRDGRAARPAAGGGAPGDAGRRGGRWSRTDDFTVDLAAKRVLDATGAAGAPDADRVAAARGARAPRRQARHPAPAAARGVGARLRRREQLPAASTWPTSAASSSPTAPAPATSSPSPAWATASSGESLTRRRWRWSLSSPQASSAGPRRAMGPRGRARASPDRAHVGHAERRPWRPQ